MTFFAPFRFLCFNNRKTFGDFIVSTRSVSDNGRRHSGRYGESVPQAPVKRPAALSRRSFTLHDHSAVISGLNGQRSLPYPKNMKSESHLFVKQVCLAQASHEFGGTGQLLRFYFGSPPLLDMVGCSRLPLCLYKQSKGSFSYITMKIFRINYFDIIRHLFNILHFLA